MVEETAKGEEALYTVADSEEEIQPLERYLFATMVTAPSSAERLLRG